MHSRINFRDDYIQTNGGTHTHDIGGYIGKDMGPDDLYDLYDLFPIHDSDLSEQIDPWALLNIYI